MTPEEEAYEEALRRIRKAEETGALALDLRGWDDPELETLTRLPPELERLTSLHSLDLLLLREAPRRLVSAGQPHIAPDAQASDLSNLRARDALTET